jgi:hypothetical protein
VVLLPAASGFFDAARDRPVRGLIDQSVWQKAVSGRRARKPAEAACNGLRTWSSRLIDPAPISVLEVRSSMLELRVSCGWPLASPLADVIPLGTIVFPWGSMAGLLSI